MPVIRLFAEPAVREARPVQRLALTAGLIAVVGGPAVVAAHDERRHVRHEHVPHEHHDLADVFGWRDLATAVQTTGGDLSIEVPPETLSLVGYAPTVMITT